MKLQAQSERAALEMAEAEAMRISMQKMEEEEEKLQMARAEVERRVAEVGLDSVCVEALTSMLTMSVGSYRDIMATLSTLVSGIVAEPADARLRLLRVKSTHFQQKLGKKEEVWSILRGIGFELRTRETLPAGLPVALGISSGPSTEPFLWLHELNMLEDYDGWMVWHERLRKIASSLDTLQSLASHRTLHLGRCGLDAKMLGVISVEEVSHSCATFRKE